MYEFKNVFVLGMARSGYEVTKVLLSLKSKVFITDGKEQEKEKVEEIENLGAKFLVLSNPEDYLTSEFDLVVKNPGVPLDHPVCKKAEELGIKIINEMELGFNLLPKNVTVIGITGSNGKTTTSTLIYKILEKGERKVHLGGNIGIPFVSMIKDIKENDILVLEISAQQIHNFENFKPNIGIITNITPTHLDFFKTFENYKQDKINLLKNQTESDIAIINSNDKESEDIKTNGKIMKISLDKKEDTYLENNYIVYKNEKIINTNDIFIKGNHNIQNAMCAITVAKLLNIDNKFIFDVLSTFGGVEHRIEYVANVKNREFYNDSKSTNTVSTIVALKAFQTPTILLLGGLDRGHSFDELSAYTKNVKLIVSYGETKERIKHFANSINIKCIVVNTLEEAVTSAFSSSEEFDTILLSPACASWDQFKDYEERGREYKKYINTLKENI